MNPGVLSVRNNRVVFVAMAFVLVGGVVAYRQMGRLEDPEFTIKEALIVTPYPGASAEEVAQEVTNPIERAVQRLGQLDRVESESSRGMSIVTARIMDRYHKDAGGEQVAWVVGPDETVARRPVKLGGATGGRVEIAEGLQPGDRVAVAGVTFLREGMKVRDLGDALGGAQP